MDNPIDWHRLFGLFLEDFFVGTPYEVELEKELAKRKQLLDVAVVRKSSGGVGRELPDGFQNMAAHNLISFKSHRATLNRWAVDELIGHYVNYRKQVRPERKKLHPEGDFRMYGVCVRFPSGLAKLGNLAEVSAGVFELPWTENPLRVLVISRMPESGANAVMQLFSGDPEKIDEAQKRSHWQTDETHGLVVRLLDKYRMEGIPMPYSLKQFKVDLKKDIISKSTPDELLAGLTLDDRLRGVPVDEFLARLSTEQLQKVSESIPELIRKGQKKQTEK